MARIRSIYPEACDSEKLAALSSDAERLFWRLQTHCDDQGRADDNARLILAKCAPLVEQFDVRYVDILLRQLADAGLIVRYVVGDKRYIEVVQWARFQHPRKPKKAERPPAPPSVPRDDAHDGNTGTAPEGEPVPHEYGTSTDPESVPVAHGEEGSGEERRPPNGGGGSREEGGTNALRGNRQRPFSEEAVPNEVVSRLQQRIASSPLNDHLAAN